MAELSLCHSVGLSLSFCRGLCPSLELGKFKLRGVFQHVEGPGLGAVESNFQGKANQAARLAFLTMEYKVFIPAPYGPSIS